MRLPLVAVVGGVDRVPEEALTALRGVWRFARYEHAADVLRAGESPEVLLLASSASRSEPLIRELRERVRPRAVLLGLGEDSSGELPTLGRTDGWVRLPVTASVLSARLASLHPRRQDTSVSISLPTGPPRQLGPFTLQQRLGVGNFGAVYKALDTRSGIHRAIKIAHPEVLEDPELRGRWLREVGLLGGVRLPGVVTIHGSGEVHGYLCLVMDLLPGEALEQRVACRGPLEVQHAIALAERLGRALGALHALGVIHRDVKPGNIVVDEHYQGTLVDLGLVRHLRSAQLTASDVVLGTAGYLSPERIKGGDGDAASDAYALAATLYFALTSWPPFRDKTPMDLINRVAGGATAAPIRSQQPNVPWELAELIDGMLLPSIESRPSMSDLVGWCFEFTHGGLSI